MGKIDQSGLRPTKIGGQALIEGVMMKGPREVAIAVRTPDQQITIKKEPVSGITQRLGIGNIPLLRGALALIDSMVLGVRSLTYATDLLEAQGEAQEPDKVEKFLYRIFGEKASDVVLYLSVAFAMVISIGVFFLAPTFVVNFLKGMISSHLALNLIEGLLRLGLFTLYVYLIAKLEDMRRVFQYHGAEHKAIYCYESGLELTVENARKFTTLHPRCGTSFLFIVMMVSMIMFSLISWSSLWARVLYRLLLLPVIAGISYEVIRFAGKSQSPVMAWVSYPGMMMQKLTTREPDDSQLEVALAALKSVLVENREETDW